MTWEVTFSKNFINRLLLLPSNVKNKLPEVVGLLQENPNNSYSCKIRNHERLYRIYLTKNYRIFYTYQNSWVKLYSVLKRQEDTYQNINIPKEGPPIYCPPQFEEEMPPPQPEDHIISKDQLSQWKIPTNYWQELLKVKSEDDLLEVNVPHHLIERIIDNLFPNSTSFEEIETSSSFIVNDPNEIEDALSGK